MSEKKKVLIVDDERLNLTVLSNLLKSDYKTVVAKSGEQALERAGSEVPPDLILLDIMMPKLSGFEVCSQLKSDPATSGIMILMVTALNELGDIERAVEAGTDDFLSKPVNKVELLKRIENMLRLRHVTDEVERMRQYIQKIEERD